MNKYIKVFDTVEEYNAYSGSTSFTSPNISYVKGNDKSYYDDNEIKHYTADVWMETIPKEELTSTTFNKVNSYITQVELPNNITTIGGEAFKGCSSLTSVTIGSGVTSIGNNAFNGCSSLTSIDIPNSITSIGSGAFSYCDSLLSFNYPSGVTTNIGLNNCGSLTSVTFSNNVTEIINFFSCAKLKRINSDIDGVAIIPSSVTSIANYGFNYQKLIKYFYFYSITPPNIGSDIFYKSGGIYQVNAIYVPSESVELYKTATNWSAYANKIQAIPNN